MSPASVRDGIVFSSDLGRLKVPAFRVLDAVQDVRKDCQLEAIALTLAALCRPLGIDPHALITRANRQLVQTDATRNPHIEAIADYAAGELK
ncbi:hypothetical protein QQS45_08300 [Alteriqipengyuania flavescens]|uniref:hypothetical protein n=1 Tax=Alteriqipengyuania flavescens TaxID=3053610 RepID=UPI0025B5CDA3|nr:hypothetical protein [Alteriqipengyuania flavescens]WJY17648.1 hypothetical protein QQW98_08295 [Alteriqipengyuania flavescens]WJY23591.1 hypothetical protein QQS45_08300 [Alteriqipengyuania flavescens]